MPELISYVTRCISAPVRMRRSSSSACRDAWGSGGGELQQDRDAEEVAKIAQISRSVGATTN